MEGREGPALLACRRYEDDEGSDWPSTTLRHERLTAATNGGPGWATDHRATESSRARTTAPRREPRHHGANLRIGELASATGERGRTLRFLGDEGPLAASRSDSEYRLFPKTMINRLPFVRNAQALGLDLREMRKFLDQREGAV